jgi:DNA transformation protein
VPAKNAYLDFVVEWLSPLGPIAARSMMGGHILYCDCVVFALVARNALYLKVDDETRWQYQALKLEPFQPFEDKDSKMSYYPPPAEFFEDPDAMLEWGRAAVAAGLRAKKKKKPSAAKKRSAIHGK